MKAQEILDDQVIHVKRGRFNSFGWEPCWNSFFDLYASPKYIEPPLIQLEDISFFLFLRKNLNDQNPKWKMPSVRQMMKRLFISPKKLNAMMKRLDAAHLLKKESGYRRGKDNANITNRYLLSDPIQTLDEFLIVASEGLFPRPLKPEWVPCAPKEHSPVYQVDTTPVSEKDTLKQTFSFLKQTSDPELDKLWESVMTNLKPHVPSATFHTFLQDLTLVSFEDGAVVIGTARPWVMQWVEERMRNRIRQALELELRISKDPRKVNTVRCVVVTEE